ncbi:MAG: ABC transporter ATP-binding protein/permease [Defluviitaleaceae bacterium]|nr:ABC transporter ATP-binding protein/permease [Defluviitaleaceae bacterium]
MTTLKKLNSIFNKATKIKLLILMLAIIFNSFLEMFILSLASPIISILMGDTSIENNQTIYKFYTMFKFESLRDFLLVLIFVFAGICLFRGVSYFVVTKVKYRFCSRRQMDLSKRMLMKTLNYSYLYHTSKNLPELQRVVLGDVTEMFALITGSLYFTADLFMTLFILAFLLITSPLMTLSVIALAGISVLIYYALFRKQILNAGAKNRSANIAMTKTVQQSLGGIKEVKLLGREGYFKNTFEKSCEVFVEVNTRFLVLNNLPKIMLETVCVVGALLIIGVLQFVGINFVKLVPQFSVFVLAAFRMLPAVMRQVTNVNDIIFRIPSVDAVHKSLFTDFDINAIRNLPPPSPSDIPPAARDITVSGLTFQYPGIETPVLKDVSFVIPENSAVAFIGQSGSGKTTLADLILGILVPKSGAIYYNGMSVHHNFAKWRTNVGYIPQFIYLLDESIRENVAFGIGRDSISDEKVWHALEQAQLADFVRGLPDALDTLVGERGVKLSGGQRQRIGIARALYDDPSILVLDEATSALDTDTENAVMSAIQGLQGSKTLIIVAHRLSTIECCSIVFQVENNTVTRAKGYE